MNSGRSRAVHPERMEYSFRPAGPDDVRTIREIAQRVIISNYTPFLGSGAVRAFIESGQSDREIDDGLENCTLMTGDGGVIGFAITDGPLLHLIMVDAACQNRGYGTELLAYVENMLFVKYPAIRLQTFEENRQAVRFYLRNGWKLAGKEALPEIGKTMLSFEKAKNGY